MLTVKEVLKKLAKYDENAEVVICGGEDWSALRVYDKEGLHQIFIQYDEDEDDDDEEDED